MATNDYPGMAILNWRCVIPWHHEDGFPLRHLGNSKKQTSIVHLPYRGVAKRRRDLLSPPSLATIPKGTAPPRRSSPRHDSDSRNRKRTEEYHRLRIAYLMSIDIGRNKGYRNNRKSNFTGHIFLLHALNITTNTDTPNELRPPLCTP